MQRLTEFNDYFYYDESSPSCLRWKVVITSANGRPMTTIGGVAGGMTKGRRYFTVCLNHNKYACHKIVWQLFGNNCNSNLDHIDRDRSNNRIDNLRAVSQQTNSENRGMSSLNKTGWTGIQLEVKPYLRYIATWKLSRVTKTKSFSVLKHGLMPAMKMAIEFRHNKIKELNNAGHQYTETHGRG